MGRRSRICAARDDLVAHRSLLGWRIGAVTHASEMGVRWGAKKFGEGMGCVRWWW